MDMNPSAHLCGCLLNPNPEELAHLLKHPDVAVIEWRLDAFIEHHSVEVLLHALPALSAPQRHPIIMTNRPQREGGLFNGSEQARFDLLQQAVSHGADWIDLESDTAEDALHSFQSQNVRIILSHHDFEGTPDRASLRRLLENMAQKGAQAIKIATFARNSHDNLRVLELIDFGREQFQVDVIAFCMGPAGRWSRIACVLLGSPWTYVQLPGQLSAASGQFTATEARSALEMIS